MIYEQNTKKIIVVKESLFVIKHTYRFRKTFASIFSAYTCHIYVRRKFFRERNDKIGIKGSFLNLFKTLAIHACVLSST